MRALAFVAALLFATPVAAQRGVVSGLRMSTDHASTGNPVTMSISGSNPCGAVLIDQGDGTSVTHPIERVPTTIHYTYTRPGTYQVRARGMGNCDGEAAATIRVTGPAVDRQTTDRDDQLRFRGMDADNDGVITRSEWRGNDQSFRTHDWNDDGVLSGDEVRVGGRRSGSDVDDRDVGAGEFRDWTERRFNALDRNGDGRVARSEWRFDLESFRRADRNRDGLLTRSEFLGEGASDDEGDYRSTGQGQVVVVDARQPWTDTGLVIRAGDRVRIEADGSVRLSNDSSDVAAPAGARSGRQASGAPFPQQRAGSLIARIGSEPIWIGDSGIITRAPATGRLYLGVNDDFFEDNSGSFRARVAVQDRIR
jgi:PKD domain/EF hand